MIARELGKLLQTEVSIQRVDPGIFNQIVIEGLEIKDQKNKSMLVVQKLAASLEIMPLLDGKIVVHTGQLFGLNANLYQETEDKPTNFQFVLDALASEDNTEPSALDLKVNSFILRNGTVSYNQLFKEKKDHFDLAHLILNDVNAHISLKELTNEKIKLKVRELSFKEETGLTLSNLLLSIEGDQNHALLSELVLEMPHSFIRLDSVSADYDLKKEFSLKEMKSYGTLSECRITPSDIKALVPALDHFDESLHLNLQFQQDGNMLTVDGLNLHSAEKSIALQAAVKAILPEENNPIHILANVQNLDIQPSGYPFLFNNLNLGKTPALLPRLGKTHFEGEITTDTKNLGLDGLLTTAVGNIISNAELTEEKHLKGIVQTSSLALGTLLADNQFGTTAFNLEVDGTLADAIPTGKLSGKVDFLEFNNYRYDGIELDALYNGNDLDANLFVNDENCTASLHANALLKQKLPSYNLHVNIAQLNTHALGLQEEESIFQGDLYADASGSNLDNMHGTVRLEKFMMQTADDQYTIDSLVIRASESEGKKTVELSSDFLQAKLEGYYSYATLPQSFIQVAERYVPSVLKNRQNVHPENVFSLKANLTDATPLNHFQKIPLVLQEEISLSSQINDVTHEIRVDIAAGSFNYDGEHYELGKVLCYNDGNDLKSSIGINRVKKGLSSSLSIEATAQEDNLMTNIAWDNNQAKESFNGTLNVQTHFSQEFDGPLNINVNILPSDITLNDTTWHIRPGKLDYTDNKVRISHLALENGPRHLIINGVVGNEPTDTLRANLKEINLEYAFDALNFHPVHMAGIATGKAMATNLLSDLDFDARLFVKNFQFEHGTLGNMNIHGSWNKEQEGINLNAYISEFASDSNDSIAVWQAFRKEIDASALTHIEGIVSPKNECLDLHVDANGTNIHFVESFIGGIFENLQGRATGWARVAGTFDDIDLTAGLKAKASVKLTSLNTVYQVESDSILLKTNRMEFNNLHLRDKDGHTGTVDGVINHYYLHDMRYAFNIDCNNFLCYDTHGFDDQTFYATAYASGHMTLKGEGDELVIDGDIETKPGTIIAYNASTPEDITDTQFITFVDKTPSAVEKPVMTEEDGEDFLPEEEEEETNIHINLNINCTPDATVRVLMDNISGDDITCHGTGNIQAEYFNKGALKLYGIFNITRGVYKMSLQEIIRKDFLLNSGTVTFNGKPFDGQLDVMATYTVNSASLRDLSPSATFSQKSTTRVNCLMNLTGNLLKPHITFDLELPNVSDEDKSMVRSLVATEDQMNRQIIYLLGIGRFYTDEYNQDSNQANQAMNSLLTSTISGQFNQILSQVANTSNWNFGANLNPGQDGLNNMEFQTMLSGSLFNNRLLINGNFGYRENALANTNFVGDFDIQWLLNQSGTISLKAYNETNDRYFTKNTLTTQGLGILLKRDFQHWSDLFRRKDSKKKSAAVTAADSVQALKPDSIQVNE